MTFVTLSPNNTDLVIHATAVEAEAVAEARDLICVTNDRDLADLTGAQMVAYYNYTAELLNENIAPVNRFATKEVGIKRLWANLQDLAERAAAIRAAEAKAKPAPKAPKAPAEKKAAAPRRGTGINLAPTKKAYPCRAGSKQAMLVDMLSRPEGATMGELLAALSGGSKPWKEVTVKSGLNWDMNKVKGYGIRTTKRGDADCYHLVLPEGMDAPLAHLPKKGA